MVIFILQEEESLLSETFYIYFMSVPIFIWVSFLSYLSTHLDFRPWVLNCFELNKTGMALQQYAAAWSVIFWPMRKRGREHHTYSIAFILGNQGCLSNPEWGRANSEKALFFSDDHPQSHLEAYYHFWSTLNTMNALNTFSVFQDCRNKSLQIWNCKALCCLVVWCSHLCYRYKTFRYSSCLETV